MGPYSHRDLRAQRQALQLIGLVAALSATLAAAAYLAPGPWLGTLAVVGLVALGGVASWWGSALVRGYEQDLRAAAAGDPRMRSSVRIETTPRRSLGTPAGARSRPSPHSRRPRAGSGGWGASSASGLAGPDGR